MIIYKVVSYLKTFSEELRYSYMATGKWRATYRVNEWTTAVTPLFAFDTLENAKEFRNQSPSYMRTEIWEAEAENVRPLKRLIRTAPVNWQSWWDKTTAGFSPAPPGTVLVDRLMLLHRVSNTEEPSPYVIPVKEN